MKTKYANGAGIIKPGIYKVSYAIHTINPTASLWSAHVRLIVNLLAIASFSHVATNVRLPGIGPTPFKVVSSRARVLKTCLVNHNPVARVGIDTFPHSARPTKPSCLGDGRYLVALSALFVESQDHLDLFAVEQHIFYMRSMRHAVFLNVKMGGAVHCFVIMRFIGSQFLATVPVSDADGLPSG